MADHTHTHSHGNLHGGLVASHSHGHDYAAANKAHFDDAAAANYDKRQDAIELTRRQSNAMIKAYPFNESETTVMDFACGPGLISRGLAPYAKKIVGVDISEAMVKQYNLRVENQGIPPEEMQAVCAELKGTAEELDGLKFDVVVCANAYHHFDSIESVTHTLAFFLKPGGSLLVSDILKSPDGVSTLKAIPLDIVAHQGGFEDADIRKAFAAAGLHLATFEKVTSAKKDGQDIDFFLTKGVKSL